MRYAIFLSLLFHLGIGWLFLRRQTCVAQWITPGIPVSFYPEEKTARKNSQGVISKPLTLKKEDLVTQKKAGAQDLDSNKEKGTPLTAQDVVRFGNELPLYPEEAERRGWEGNVLLKLSLSREGGVSDVLVAESSGYEILDHQAEHKARSWHFPGIAGTEDRTRYVILRFHLQD